MIRSPSQWPATRRSVASSGRSSMLIMPMIGALRPPRDRRGRRRVRLERSMIPCSRSVVRAIAQNPGVDRLVRHEPLPSLLGTPCRAPKCLHRWPRLAVPPAGFCLGVRERARSASTLAPRAGQASIIWGSWGVICAAARSRPRPRADTHKPYWLRAISRETTETSRPIRSAILRNDQPCSSPRAIAARSDIVNIRRNTTSRL